MTSKKLFSQFFSKQNDKKHVSQHSKDDDENEEPNKTFQRSRSGRLKEISRKRPSVMQDTFLPPKADNLGGRTDYSLPNREISGQETARLSLSIRDFMRADDQLHANKDSTGNNPPLSDEIF